MPTLAEVKKVANELIATHGCHECGSKRALVLDGGDHGWLVNSAYDALKDQYDIVYYCPDCELVEGIDFVEKSSGKTLKEFPNED